MRNVLCRSIWMFLALAALLLAPAIYADNEVMGRLELQGKSHVERTSGVWVDGQYVGYLKELKGDKKVLLLPGQHTISVRQDGYQDFTKTIEVRPGETTLLRVSMAKAATPPLPREMATIKFDMEPSRAAVFMDGMFVGHVGELKGPGRGLLVPPGMHKFEVALAGYKTYETTIDVPSTGTVKLKTELVLNNKAPLSGPVLEENLNTNASKPAPGAMAAPAH
jgi:PEGA domain-containing protein